jgi:hypothetical protein
MDAFSELTPRQAGDRIVEPRLTFEVVDRSPGTPVVGPG